MSTLFCLLFLLLGVCPTPTHSAQYNAKCGAPACTAGVNVTAVAGDVLNIDVELIDLDLGTESIELILAGTSRGLCVTGVGNLCGRMTPCLRNYVIRASDVVGGEVDVRLRASQDVSNDCSGLAVNAFVDVVSASAPTAPAAPTSAAPAAPSPPTAPTAPSSGACQTGGTPCVRGGCTNGNILPCVCNANDTAGYWQGTRCDRCADNYFGTQCNAFCIPELSCSGHGACSTAGSCSCTQSVSGGFWAGSGCDNCSPNFYASNCTVYCRANLTCSGHGSCNVNGACDCFAPDANGGRWAGTDCRSCATGYIGTGCNVFCNDTRECGGHGMCSALVGSVVQCACHNDDVRGHWDPSTNCQTCLAGYTQASGCTVLINPGPGGPGGPSGPGSPGSPGSPGGPGSPASPSIPQIINGGKSGNNTALWIVLGVVGGLLLLAAAIATAAGLYWRSRKTEMFESVVVDRVITPMPLPDRALVYTPGPMMPMPTLPVPEMVPSRIM